MKPVASLLESAPRSGQLRISGPKLGQELVGLAGYGGFWRWRAQEIGIDLRRKS